MAGFSGEVKLAHGAEGSRLSFSGGVSSIYSGNAFVNFLPAYFSHVDVPIKLSVKKSFSALMKPKGLGLYCLDSALVLPNKEVIFDAG